MQRDDYFRISKIPLLIGGATTSRVHTAVKIAPHYEGPVVYVPDAIALASACCSDLLSRRARATPTSPSSRPTTSACACSTPARRQTPLVTLAEARANKTPIDWAGYAPPEPKFIGRRVFKNYDLAEIAALHRLGPVLPDLGPGRRRIPAILNDEVVGDVGARACSPTASACCKRIDRRPLADGATAWSASARPTRSNDDDIEIYTDESRSEVADHLARPAPADASSRWSTACAARTAAWPTSSRRKGVGRDDYVGLFAVTAGLGVEKKEKQFVADLDDYSRHHAEGAGRPPGRSLRRAPAPARAHRPLGLCAPTRRWQRRADRREVPRHPPGAGLSGLPGPHASSATCSSVLQCDEIGMALTESLAMMPAASVSGFYLAHPEATLLQRRQDRRRPAARTGRGAMRWTTASAQRALAPLLS